MGRAEQRHVFGREIGEVTATRVWASRNTRQIWHPHHCRTTHTSPSSRSQYHSTALRAVSFAYRYRDTLRAPMSALLRSSYG
ncbi:hypothetical protein HBI72_000820 [Parastagonospora nodorum]|nr:hypothetical protein HBI72_000820 [Parastagonospora nodorum]KAH6056422.1 hypothetical protein HBI54_010600 [Parastagonospora nodorum]